MNLANPRKEFFFASPAEAQLAGFRPCRRCLPDQPQAPDPQRALVENVCRYLDAAPDERPTLQDLAERFGVTPRIAMLSFSNFGSTPHPQQDKVQRATALVRQQRPDLEVDGEMQADIAISPELLQESFPFSSLAGGANILIFPCLNSSNAGYKLAQKFSGAEAIGPILLGVARPGHVLTSTATVRRLVNMTALAVVESTER